MQQKTKSKSALKSGKTQSFKTASKQKKDLSFPLEKGNFIIIAAGILLIIIGYLLMAQNSVDGFVPTVISPILLFLGYCILIPYGILKKAGSEKLTDTEQLVSDSGNQTDRSSSSTANIKTS